MNFRVYDLHHLQIAIPKGGETAVIDFYVELLGLAQLPKPAHLIPRGGIWCALGARQIHFGVDPDFAPATKGHPAFLVEDLAALRTKLEDRRIAVTEEELLPGYDRFYTTDPFGNRLEFLSPTNEQLKLF